MTVWVNPVKEQKVITDTRELAEYIREKIVGIEDMTEEDREKMNAKIRAKLESGKKLSQKEMEYLRQTDPIMYMYAVRIQRTAEAVEEQLKHAKSKQEADLIISSAMSGLSKKDPDRKYIIAAVNRVASEFRKSGEYDKLPATMEEANKKKENGVNNVKFSNGEDEEEDNGFSLMNWSPLTEVFESMPTFSAGA